MTKKTDITVIFFTRYDRFLRCITSFNTYFSKNRKYARVIQKDRLHKNTKIHINWNVYLLMTNDLIHSFKTLFYVEISIFSSISSITFVKFFFNKFRVYERKILQHAFFSIKNFIILWILIFLESEMVLPSLLAQKGF